MNAKNTRTPAELLTVEFLAQMFQDISLALPDGMDEWTRQSNTLRLARERILARLAEA
jgi:hypothetical protein